MHFRTVGLQTPIRAGLEMRPKGDGLAIYSRHDEKVTPIKASTLHPDLTLQCLEKWLGDFELSPDVVNEFDDDGIYLGSNFPQEFVYDARAHVRDQGARSERRLARAIAREELDSRYKVYKNSWVRPTAPDTDASVNLRLSKRKSKSVMCLITRSFASLFIGHLS